MIIDRSPYTAKNDRAAPIQRESFKFILFYIARNVYLYFYRFKRVQCFNGRSESLTFDKLTVGREFIELNLIKLKFIVQFRLACDSPRLFRESCRLLLDMDFPLDSPEKEKKIRIR